MNIPEDLKYTKEHEWARLEDDIVTIGVSDYAQHELGDIVFVDLPKVGKKVKQLEVLCEVESVKAVSEVYAPLNGQVTEINEDLDNEPEKVNNSPYEEGWIAKLRLDDAKELDGLMTADEYKSYLQTC